MSKILSMSPFFAFNLFITGAICSFCARFARMSKINCKYKNIDEPGKKAAAKIKCIDVLIKTVSGMRSGCCVRNGPLGLMKNSQLLLCQAKSEADIHWITIRILIEGVSL